MKFFKWKIFWITSLVCLLPVLPGILLWDRLPDNMAIHFDIYGVPDSYTSKGIVVFGFPVLMVVLQMICCIINDINAKKHGTRKKFERVTKWFIPCITFLLQIITLAVGLGLNVDVRKAVAVIVGIMFLVIGNYLPKLDYINNYNYDTTTARKINRFLGLETVIMGVLFIISAFLPPVSTIVCLCLLIIYAVIGSVYGIVTGRK